MEIWNVPSFRNFRGPSGLLPLEVAYLSGKAACSEGEINQSAEAKAKKAMIFLSIAPRLRIENRGGLLIPTPSLARGLP